MGFAARFFILVVWCCLVITGGYGNAWGGIQAPTPQSVIAVNATRPNAPEVWRSGSVAPPFVGSGGKKRVVHEAQALPKSAASMDRLLVYPVPVKQVSEERLGKIGAAVAKLLPFWAKLSTLLRHKKNPVSE